MARRSAGAGGSEIVLMGSAAEGAPAGRLRDLFDRAGARWVEVPVLHPADPFLETAGEDIRRRMFVTEGSRGERLALRPDFTIPVCLQHLRSGAGPARYAYEGLVFRRHDSGAPERLETGFEDIGRADRVAADAETLALAIAAAGAVAPGPLDVRLGDIGLFVALLAALGLPQAWRRRLRRSFGMARIMEANLDRLSRPRVPDDMRFSPDIRAAADRHDRGALVALLRRDLDNQGHTEGLGRSAEEIAARFLDQRELSDAGIDAAALRTLREFLAIAGDYFAAAGAVARFARSHGADLGAALVGFAERADAVARLVPGAAIRFEAGFGRPLDYYTGLVFEVRGGGFAAPIGGGGRYDRLVEMLGGPPVPAVGFTLRLDLGAPA